MVCFFFVFFWGEGFFFVCVVVVVVFNLFIYLLIFANMFECILCKAV